MRLLLVTQYYPPESGAPQNRLADLAERLHKWGHEITVVTALPNYPRGEIFEGYRGRVRVAESCGGVRVIRTWIYATHQRGMVHRLLSYGSFVISSVVLGMTQVSTPDIVLVESPPLFLGIAGLVIKWVTRAKLVLNVSDLWPESAVAMGIVRNSVLIRVSICIEEFIYFHADLITGQTRGIIENIKRRFPVKSVQLLTNGVDIERFQPTETSEKPRRLGANRECVVGYAGLHGLAQGLETVLYAARILLDHGDIVFKLVGDGVEKARLEEMARQLGLRNVRFLPAQAREAMRDVLLSFDMALVPLRRMSLFKGALPSKMFEAMGCGVPMIVSVDGEARALVEAAQAGVYVEPEEPEQMARAILLLAQNEEARRRMGRNGRRYVVEHYDREQIARRFEEMAVRLCGEGAASGRHGA